MDIVAGKQPTRLRILWAITRKEIINFARHPYYLVSLGIPIFMSLVFAVLFSTLAGPDYLPILVYDPGDSVLVGKLNQLPQLEVTQAATADQLIESLTGDTVGGIVIPADFDTAVANNQSPEITIYLNPETGSADRARFQRILSEQVWGMRYETAPAQLIWTEQDTNDENIPVDSLEQYLLMTLLLLGVTMTAISILPQMMVEEKEKAALSALLASPAELSDVMVGKALAIIFYALLLSAALALLNEGWVGNWPISVLAVLLLTLFVTGFGLLFGMWTKTKSQCNTYGTVLVIVLNLPVWFAVIAIDRLAAVPAFLIRAIPTYHFTQILPRALENKVTLAQTGQHWAGLGISILIIYIFLGWQMRRQRTRFTIDS